jgi:L-lysine exporter family protein LysE/ArgO
LDVSVFLSGLGTGLGLIVAIGAQNAFVLRQGLHDEHVFAVCLTCALSDAILIAVGVGGFGTIVARLPWLEPVMRYGGAGFLAWYGVASLRSALRSRAALAADTAPRRGGLGDALLACLAFTWLNPHVYLDTVVLLGSIATQFPGAAVSFGVGAASASLLFFFSLGYGARRLAPLFARPAAWRLLEAAIAVMMATLSLRLVAGA